ncbi:glycosyltransferase [Dermabacteraceae bacterium P7006]
MNTQGAAPVPAVGEKRPTAVAVIVPAKDEQERIADTVRAALALPEVDLVVVVDDGSRDATAALARDAGALVVRRKQNQGKAAAMETGARLVAMREAVAGTSARALLFIDADMGQSAAEASPLIESVLTDGVDMAIANLPPQPGASGMGVVVRTARRGIEKATGYVAKQPLSGTRCMTRETWEACLPLAPGWGVETSLTIDALRAGYVLREVPCQLSHRPSGRDLRGQLHRLGQLKDVCRALLRKK